MDDRGKGVTREESQKTLRIVLRVSLKFKEPHGVRI